jgi:ATP-dependent DNA helicase RecQ
MYNPDLLLHTLKARFGFDTFRPLQQDIIQHVLQGGDALVIMPTGGGKSICYQLPALLQSGMALVISPLISLMNDQVSALQAKDIAAGALHSGSTPADINDIYIQIANKELKILYVSPERAVTPRFMEFILKQEVSLIAIDEAHCVSIWGNDFRPEYAQLHKLTSQFTNVPVLGLTATADKATQEDIKQQLRLNAPRTFLYSFERPNIYLQARPGIERIDQIKEFLKSKSHASGIIYCLARKTTETVAEMLRRAGYNAEAYHAEMENIARKRVQDAFQRDEIQIVCATIAFGMGIDKPNIRWIIHYNLPKNIENYYQEIGRSGRDGLPAEAMMFYSFRDLSVYREFIFKSEANETFKEVQSKKLDRIWEFSQATNCRTNVILNYFGEYRSASCNHCDNCRQPPVGFDGTRIAQMALSACKRSNENIGLNLLVDVLRGSSRREIIERGLHKIKTYGAGREYNTRDWTHYITQLINQGLLEIDYTKGGILKCTPLTDAVLFDNKEVTLHKIVEAPIEPVAAKRPKIKRYTEELFQRIEELNNKLSAGEGVPAYAVFPKPSLRAIASHGPLTIEEFAAIEGIGEYKAKKYGQSYLDLIRTFMMDQDIVKKPRGVTYIETLNLFQQGMTIEEIAVARKMAPSTIATHLAKLYERGEPIELNRMVSKTELQLAKQAWRASGFSETMSKIKEEVGDSLDYVKLTLAIAILRKAGDGV